ncbi:MAG: hypothetical protein IRZ31_17985 [Thermogemmatispora sp.]|uniref:TOTE conflict system archaeo-eukaryotic primase domain-containing protein n=1 Tax=Thermogemmatispora sp. TaxID=1968838 RepID=UPI0026390DFA|nr:CHC2 zinc finger domain-containing protein [Thermogemmatispora sp.]MBX5458786.1 hypothetical protein [Thermogemmatispora sp.]
MSQRGLPLTADLAATGSPALLLTWLERLGGRRTAYGVQRPDGRYRCVRAPLTPAVLAAHLAGRLTLGHYVLDEHGRCSYAVLDADQSDGFARLVTLHQALAAQGYPAVLEASRRGGHLWLWLDQPTPAAQVRAWLRSLVDWSSLEVFPKQDQVAGGYGSLIRLPLGLHRRSGRRYPFLVADPDGHLHPVAGSREEQLAWWLAQPAVRLPDQVLPAPIPTMPAPPAGATRVPAARGHPSYSLSPRGRPAPVRVTPILAWCLAQDPYAVIGRYVALDRRGVGCCPFGWHHRAGQDRHPSFKVFPHTPAGNCWYCYTWRRGGSLFDFFRLLWQVDARTAWQWIKEGREP